MFHNNWSDSAAEEELALIKKYGLEAGQLAYKNLVDLRDDQEKHPEKYPEIMKDRELRRIQAAKRYNIEGSPEVAIGDMIYAEGKEMIVHDIMEGYLYVRTVAFNSDCKPYLYQGQYKKIVSAMGEYGDNN